MPKLIYFPVQGRAQGIKYLLGAKGVAFEDQVITGAEWGPMKEAGTYGQSQLPVWVNDDGSYVNQSIAILKMLAFEHGYTPETPAQVYEAEWFYSTGVDIIEKPERFVLLRDEPTEEDKQKCISLLANFITKCDQHWADGRAHVAGDKVPHADFYMLALITSHYDNAHGKHAEIKAATQEQLAAASNVTRVMASMRELCAAQIAALTPSSI